MSEQMKAAVAAVETWAGKEIEVPVTDMDGSLFDPWGPLILSVATEFGVAAEALEEALWIKGCEEQADEYEAYLHAMRPSRDDYGLETFIPDVPDSEF